MQKVRLSCIKESVMGWEVGCCKVSGNLGEWVDVPQCIYLQLC